MDSRKAAPTCASISESGPGHLKQSRRIRANSCRLRLFGQAAVMLMRRRTRAGCNCHNLIGGFSQRLSGPVSVKSWKNAAFMLRTPRSTSQAFNITCVTSSPFSSTVSTLAQILHIFFPTLNSNECFKCSATDSAPYYWDVKYFITVQIFERSLLFARAVMLSAGVPSLAWRPYSESLE